jgi:hypothetical protein
MIMAMLLTASSALAGWPGPSLHIDGDCPGVVDMELYTSSGSTVSVYFSESRGYLRLPWGECSGTVTALGGSPKLGVSLSDLDGDGVMVFSPYVPEAACGKHIQFLDLGTCEWSNPETVGDDEDARYDYYAEYETGYEDDYRYYYPYYGADYREGYFAVYHVDYMAKLYGMIYDYYPYYGLGFEDYTY